MGHTEFLGEERSNLRHNAALSQVFPCHNRKASRFDQRTRRVYQREHAHFEHPQRCSNYRESQKDVGKVAFALCLQQIKAVWKNCSPLFRLFRELSVENWQGNKRSVFGEASQRKEIWRIFPRSRGGLSITQRAFWGRHFQGLFRPHRSTESAGEFPPADLSLVDSTDISCF